MKARNQQGYLVLNKLSGCLNFWIFLFSPGAVTNRTYRAWGVKIELKNRKLNRPDGIRNYLLFSYGALKLSRVRISNTLAPGGGSMEKRDSGIGSLIRIFVNRIVVVVISIFPIVLTHLADSGNQRSGATSLNLKSFVIENMGPEALKRSGR